MSQTIPYGGKGFLDEAINEMDVRAYQKPLIRIGDAIDWSIFSKELDRTFGDNKTDLKEGGRPHFDRLLMFKILVLQKINSLADDETSYQIADRRSFKLFLGMTDQDKVPDGQTIHDFRQTLVESESFDRIFDKFLEWIRNHLNVVFAQKGVLVDATFVEVPKNRNTREENEMIKSGTPPEHIAANPHKDKDARWAKKNEEIHYGYKNHVKVDAGTKLILASTTTTASVHDSQAMGKLVKPTDRVVYADSAYTGVKIQADLKKKKVRSKICSKGCRGRNLTRMQAERNRKISRVRSRVEHIFAQMTVSMRALYQRCIGLLRNAGNIKLTNLVYNMLRTEQIIRLGLV